MQQVLSRRPAQPNDWSELYLMCSKTNGGELRLKLFFRKHVDDPYSKTYHVTIVSVVQEQGR